VSISKYGLRWPDTDELEVEFKLIRARGKMTIRGADYGLGLAHHYSEAARLLWPGDDQHRWSKLVESRLATEPVTVIIGPGDAGKTYPVSKHVLVDWWAYPDNTLWLLSSTELRGAELRIWGTLKQLFNRARRIRPWLVGNVLESKHAITTEEISDSGSEGRLLTKGLIFVPCKQGGQWVGMGCFPGEQRVNTVSGPKPIRDVKPGEWIVNACGTARVLHRSVRTVGQLVRVTIADGRSFDCTADHPVLTEYGWIRAIDIRPQTRLLSPGDTLPHLQERFTDRQVPDEVLLRILQEKELVKSLPRMRQELRAGRAARGILFSELQCQMEMAAAADRFQVQGAPFFRSMAAEDCGYMQCNNHGESRRTPEAQPPNEKASPKTTHPKTAAQSESLQWGSGYDCGRGNALTNVSKSLPKPQGSHRRKLQTPPAPLLQSRSCLAEVQARSRSGWKVPPNAETEVQGRRARRILCQARVESVEILKSEGDPRYSRSAGGYQVYNLEIDGHPSYTVNGILVHNSFVGIKPVRGEDGSEGRMGHVGDECGLMGPGFLDAYSNWFGKENFQGILTGNFQDYDDPLGRAAEPVDGWDNWHDTGKTQEWRSKFYNAAVIDLDGRDSPNNDHPGFTRYKYLVGAKKLNAVRAAHGEDSWQYWSQCVGKPRALGNIKRVLTKQLCDNNGAFDDVVWAGTGQTRVGFLDAAYGGVGGDRCIAGYLEFGADVEGRTVVSPHPLVTVPVRVAGTVVSAEDQIATFCRQYFAGVDVPPENFFFDGRGTLAVALARIWSSSVNVVDFGGPATDRPVSHDEYVWDGDQQTRRLKLCVEHYSKFVTELWFAVYYLVISKQMRQLPREAAGEFYKREWKYTKGNRIEVETKADMKKRTNYSPDLADAIVIGCEGARRLGLQVQLLKDPDAEGAANVADWLEIELRKHRKMRQKNELRYV
jgi:hypothetical protein